jgi:uncharacterized surface protein with fasciclin (FAS1) repeats
MDTHTDRTAWGIAIFIIILVLGLLWLSFVDVTVPPVRDDDFFSAPVSSTTAPTSTVPVASRQVRLSNDIVSIVESLQDGDTFFDLLVTSGVSKEIRGSGPYTIFVPRNIAFVRLPAKTMQMSPADTKDFVRYHIVAGRAIDIDELKNASIAALSDEILNFTVDEGLIARVDNSIIIEQYKAKNGIIYLIDAPLFPPK